MAIYHCQTTALGRGSGRSAVVAAAFRAGACLGDERQGITHDYSGRRSVLHTQLVLPDGAGVLTRAELWNAAERAEKRKNGRTAREWELALPRELNAGERQELALRFARGLASKYGCAVDVALHQANPRGDQRNWHAHLLATTRKVYAGALRQKCDIELSDRTRLSMGLAPARVEVEAVRQMWAREVNQALERAGSPKRVDHRSLVAQREEALQKGDHAKAAERPKSNWGRQHRWSVAGKPLIAAINCARCRLRTSNEKHWCSNSTDCGSNWQSANPGIRQPFRIGERMLLVAILIGVTVSTAKPIGIIAALVLLPAVVLRPPSRWRCYYAATGYYAGALWPLAVGAKNFFGPDVSILGAIAFWVVCALLMALPYALLWTKTTRQLVWRAPVALLIGVIPPLGLIGFASPLTAAGFLFPACSWVGIALAMAGCGLVAAYPRYGIPSLAAVAVVANLLYAGDRQSPIGWQAVDTHFGAISHGPVSPLREYLAAQEIQAQAAASIAKVVVFPESVVPRWTASTDLFWKSTIDGLRRDGKVALIGAMIPQSLHVRSTDISAAVELLRIAHVAWPASQAEEPYSYQNAAIIRGAQSGVFLQRVPVPVSVWKPLARGGARLHLAGPAVMELAGQRAAILICYEQVIPWTFVTTALAQPTIFVGMSNDHWAIGTTIPQWQALCLRAWSRLFHVPYLLAVNT